MGRRVALSMIMVVQKVHSVCLHLNVLVNIYKYIHIHYISIYTLYIYIYIHNQTNWKTVSSSYLTVIPRHTNTDIVVRHSY